jgi:hypothetical protein
MEHYKILDECIPDGQDFQDWVYKTHLRIHPKIIQHYNINNTKDEDEDEDEIQPHCYICFNMNMNLNVTCFNCDKLYCKNHSYCILGNDDMPYCSQKCFRDC